MKQMINPPVSDIQVLETQVCATTLRLSLSLLKNLFARQDSWLGTLVAYVSLSSALNNSDKLQISAGSLTGDPLSESLRPAEGRVPSGLGFLQFSYSCLV